jgi:dihydroorotate dehydrogenase subfamily 1
LRNPVVTASGCFASGREINRFFDVRRLGAVIVKSVTMEPRRGLPTPRMVETPSGMLNAIGLQNPGIDAWLATDLPWLVEHRVPTIVSIAGNTISDYRHLGERLRSQPGVIAIEANISCPNVEDRNIVFACREEATYEAIGQAVRSASVPVFAKLTPDVTDIVAIADAYDGERGLGNTARDPVKAHLRPDGQDRRRDKERQESSPSEAFLLPLRYPAVACRTAVRRIIPVPRPRCRTGHRATLSARAC